MKSSIYLTILILCFAITATGKTFGTAKDHVDLISAYYEASNSSSIMIMSFFTDHDNLLKTDLIFNMQALLARDKIMTSNINIPKLYSNYGIVKQLKLERTRRSDETLLVFLIMSGRDLMWMRNVKDWAIQYEMIDLVLFLVPVKFADSATDVCKNPPGNHLRLSKGTSLLVKCYQDNVIREWHALNKEEIAIHERASWEPRTGLIQKSDKLVSNDDDVLNGKVLNVASNAFLKSGSERRKLFDDLIGTLGWAGNFTVKNFEKYERRVGDTDIDYWKGPFAMAEERLNVDFSDELEKNEYILIVKKPDPKVLIGWLAYFQPFELDVWIALVLSVIFIQVIRVFIERKLETQLGVEESVENDFVYICGILCQQGLPEFPKWASLRIFYCTILIFSFTVMSMYSASFVCELTTSGETSLPFNSLEEFVKVKSHKLIHRALIGTYDKLKNLTVSPWKEAGYLLMEKNEQPKTLEEAMRIVCQNKVALYTKSNAMDSKYMNLCSMVKIGIGDIKSFGMITRKYSAFSRPMNLLPKKVRNTGVFQRMYSKYEKSLRPFFEVAEPADYPSASLRDLTQLFTFFLSSVIISVIILLCENLYSWFKKMQEVKKSKLTRPKAALFRKRKKVFKATSYHL